MPFPAPSEDYGKLVGVAMKKPSNPAFRNLPPRYRTSEILDNLPRRWQALLFAFFYV